MKIKPIDYTGCHPVIKEQLQKGNSVYCRCWYDTSEKLDNNFTEEWIIGFSHLAKIPTYFTESEESVMYAEPIEIKRVLKDPVSLMQAMVEHGWVYNNFVACWYLDSMGFMSWHCCGKEWNGVKLPDYFYEEIEV